MGVGRKEEEDERGGRGGEEERKGDENSVIGTTECRNAQRLLWGEGGEEDVMVLVVLRVCVDWEHVLWDVLLF